MGEKKIVNSYCPEFGYELLSAVPYAYNLYLKGQLEETISAYDTKCLYFFSPKHTETNCQRSWENMKTLWNIDFPNIHIHRKELDWDKFSAPPFKEHYKKDAIKFKKETLVIFNRYNYEWGKPPVNFIDLDTLSVLLNMLQDRYQVVYINIKGYKKYYDEGVDALDLGDDELLEKFPKVITINKLLEMYPNLTYNEVQVRLFANCEKYISSNGGQLILSAYFGGENIIYSKTSREHDPNVNSFYRWYHKLGNGVFHLIKEKENLIQLVKEKWVDNSPLINILIRTSGRPNYFKNCINSIYNQTYSNWNIIVGVDDEGSVEYVQPEKCKMIRYNYDKVVINQFLNNEDYGIPFKFNLYINDLQKQVNSGYCLILDDDNALYDKDSLQKIIQNISYNDEFLIWRVKFPNRLVPSDENFGKHPVVKDIDTAGLCFNYKDSVEWEPYKRGDYRVAKKLFNTVENKVFINDVITKLQRETEDGFGRRDDLKISKSRIVILSTLWNANRFIPQFITSIKTQTVKDFIVYVVDDFSTDGSYELLHKLTNGDRRFKIFKNNHQKFKTQNFFEIINDKKLINDNDIIIELDGDDAFYNNTVLEKVRKDFTDNIWIAGYKWVDNKGKLSPFKGRPNADKPRSLPWSFSAMRVFRAFLFRNIKKQDLMFRGEFVRAANDVTYGMPMLEMSGNEHYYHSNEITYLYNWHSLNSHTKQSSIKNPNLQKEVEKHIYSLPRYQKLNNLNMVSSYKTEISISNITRKERVDVPNNEKLNGIKKIVKITGKPVYDVITNEVIINQNDVQIKKTAADVNAVKENIRNLFITKEFNQARNDTQIQVNNVVVKKNPDIKKIKEIINVSFQPKSDFIKHDPIKIQPKNSVKVLDENKLKEFKNQKNNQINIVPEIKTTVVKPQDKKEIDKRRKEFENIFLYGPKGKKEINPISPKSIGVSI